MANLTDLLKKYSIMEKEYADNLYELSRNTNNFILKIILEAVAQDSIKHSLIYETLIHLKDERAKLISEREYDTISREIDKHIRIEAEMIKNSEKLMQELDEKVGKFLVASIIRDEKFHHDLLVQVRDIIIKRETLLNSERWMKVWRKTLYRE
jgi:hypothetical protein